MGKIEMIKQCIQNAQDEISKLTPEILNLPAFNTHKIKHLLNNLGSISTRYLECGLHKAGGFICALYENNTIGLGVDNWSQFEQDGESKKVAYLNCEKYLYKPQYFIRDADCFKITKEYINDTSIVSPINNFDLYTYDADHSLESQYKGVVDLLPLMADEFILCIDDTEWEAPRIATLKAIEYCKLEILFHQHLFDGVMGGEWWNGIDIFYLKKTI